MMLYKMKLVLMGILASSVSGVYADNATAVQKKINETPKTQTQKNNPTPTQKNAPAVSGSLKPQNPPKTEIKPKPQAPKSTPAVSGSLKPQNPPKTQIKSENPTPKNQIKTQKTTQQTQTQPTQHDDKHDVYRLNFASPSQNIVCGGDVLPAYGGAKGVSCYVKTMSNKPLITKPKFCRGNWGNVFELGQKGVANLACYGDTPYSDKPQILPYGKTIRGNGWYCTSLPAGIKCTNYQKHGFEIGRDKQVFF